MSLTAPDSTQVAYWRQAKWFRQGRAGNAIKHWVVHSAETPETSVMAENLVNYFATTSRLASTHYSVDSDSIGQSVAERDTCYGAAGANLTGIHIEHAGRARQTRAEWMDPFGLDMLDRSAELAAERMSVHGIPPIVLDEATFNRGDKGVVTHVVVTRATGLGTHWDPGPEFPMDVYMKMIRKYMGVLPPMPGPTPPGGTVKTFFGNAKLRLTHRLADATMDHLVYVPRSMTYSNKFYRKDRRTGVEKMRSFGNRFFADLRARIDGDRITLTVREGANAFVSTTWDA